MTENRTAENKINEDNRVLVVNAGSSSLKLELFPDKFSLQVERIGGDAVVTTSFAEVEAEAIPNHETALKVCLEALGKAVDLETVRAVGHRVVHGGEVYTEPTVITKEVLETLRDLSALAPLHNPANIEGILAARALLPRAFQVAVFDTAFHSTLPPKAYLYGLPHSYYRQGVRKYGFHGTSHDYVTREAARLLGKPREALKIVSLHLGNGSSAAAVSQGKPIDTSMGMTPLDGLLMGTRTGEIDPGVLLHLLESGMAVSDLTDLLNKRSGLLGLSGVSNDVRDVRAAARSGNEAAQNALAVFCYRIRKTVGAYAAALGGLDAVVFTGGIGENDAATRVEALEGLSFLGVNLDKAKNQAHETIISTAASPVAVLVVPTDEEGMIAEAALALQETAYLLATPSLRESVREGLETPPEETSDDPGW